MLRLKPVRMNKLGEHSILSQTSPMRLKIQEI